MVVWQVPGRRDVHIVVGTDGEGENAAVVGEQLDPNLQEPKPSDKIVIEQKSPRFHDKVLFVSV